MKWPVCVVGSGLKWGGVRVLSQLVSMLVIKHVIRLRWGK